MRKYGDNRFLRDAHRRSKSTKKICELNILNHTFNSHLPLFPFAATLLQSLSSSDVEFSHNHDYFLLRFKKAFEPLFSLINIIFRGKKRIFGEQNWHINFTIYIFTKPIDRKSLFVMNFEWTDSEMFVRLSWNWIWIKQAIDWIKNTDDCFLENIIVKSCSETFIHHKFFIPLIFQ